MRPEHLYLASAVLMLIDALGYSLGAVRQIHEGIAPKDAYWDRRLLLNVLLANAGLYFTALFAFVGAYAGSRHIGIARVMMSVTLVTCLYSVVTIPAFTPGDWKHAIPRGLAALAIIIGLVV